jgi:hypothetical protein
MGLRVTTAADYAIRAMIHLACLPEGGLALRSEIAEAQAIPASFMAKILRSLVRARLLRSSRGVNGGFSTAQLCARSAGLCMVGRLPRFLRLAVGSGKCEGHAAKHQSRGAGLHAAA